jgi:hypothetical protein
MELSYKQWLVVISWAGVPKAPKEALRGTFHPIFGDGMVTVAK